MILDLIGCDLPSQKESSVVVFGIGVVGIVKDALPLAEIAQHFRSGFARPVVERLVRVVRVVAGRSQNKLLAFEHHDLNDGYLDGIAETGVFVDQRHLPDQMVQSKHVSSQVPEPTNC